jgi:hypothetical protein
VQEGLDQVAAARQAVATSAHALAMDQDPRLSVRRTGGRCENPVSSSKSTGSRPSGRIASPSTKQIDRIEDNLHYQHNPRAGTSFIKQAVLMAYKTRVLRAGARYRLDYEQSR